MTEKNNLLSQAERDQIDKWLLRYPADERRSGVLEALRIVQANNNGSLTTELMDAVADHLGIPAVAVYEVATFYTMYYLSPVGKHVVNICTNISCMLVGSEKIVEHCQKRLGINLNETTPDGKFTLKEVECLGACTTAPVCQIGNQYYEQLTVEKMDDILKQCEQQKVTVKA